MYKILLTIIFLSTTVVLSRYYVWDNVTNTEGSVRKKVILISIDGLKPDFYLSQNNHMPHIRSFVENGSYALSMEPVFPTMTYPNHTTMITGEYPSQHGVESNLMFDPVTGTIGDWLWHSHYNRARTLFQYVKEAGGTTAAIRWPVTVNANAVDYLIPEIFNPNKESANISLMAQHSHPPELQKMVAAISNLLPQDEQTVLMLKEILKLNWPDFIAMHLVELDSAMHEYGLNGAQLKKALAEIDKRIGLIEGILGSEYCMILAGDHGFSQTSKIFRPNVFFKNHGWLEWDRQRKLVKDWQVIAHVNGGSAGVVVKNKKNIPDVMSVIKKTTDDLVIIDKNELKKMNTYSAFDFALVGKQGLTFSGGYQGEEFIKTKIQGGHHGQLHTDSEMQTGLLMKNCGFSKHNIWPHVSIMSITPTIGQIMGLKITDKPHRPLNMSIKQGQ